MELEENRMICIRNQTGWLISITNSTQFYTSQLVIKQTANFHYILQYSVVLNFDLSKIIDCFFIITTTVTFNGYSLYSIILYMRYIKCGSKSIHLTSIHYTIKSIVWKRYDSERYILTMTGPLAINTTAMTGQICKEARSVHASHQYKSNNKTNPATKSQKQKRRKKIEANRRRLIIVWYPFK